MSSNVLAGHFHELANGFFDQFLNIFHAACVCHLWQFTDFLDAQFLQVEGDSIPHLSGGLRKVLDGLSSVVGAAYYFPTVLLKLVSMKRITPFSAWLSVPQGGPI